MFRVNEVLPDDSVKERKEAMHGVGWREVIIAGVDAIEKRKKIENKKA